jgi:hypothetical protein
MSASGLDAAATPAPPPADLQAAAKGTSAHETGSAPPAAGDQHHRRTPAEVLKDIGLFFAAPFITIAYLPLFPFVGLSMLLKARDKSLPPRQAGG